jgi:hypothetical protein
MRVTLPNGMGVTPSGIRNRPWTVPVTVMRTLTSTLSPACGSTEENRPPRPSGSETSTLNGPSKTFSKVATPSFEASMARS